jgi:hypothetical protein
MRDVGISHITPKQWYPVHTEENNCIVLMRLKVKTHNYFFLLECKVILRYMRTWWPSCICPALGIDKQSQFFPLLLILNSIPINEFKERRVTEQLLLESREWVRTQLCLWFSKFITVWPLMNMLTVWAIHRQAKQMNMWIEWRNSFRNRLITMNEIANMLEI